MGFSKIVVNCFAFKTRMIRQYDAGRYWPVLRILLTVLLFQSGITSSNAQAFWTETFGDNGGFCDQGNEADNFVSVNGVWTVTPIGTQDIYANEWYISATEPGQSNGSCAVFGCHINTSLSNRTLHVGNVPFSPNSGALCPTGDCGAVYDPGGFQNEVLTNKRVESPIIDCSGQFGVQLSFIYFENGDAANADNTYIEYWDGISWSTIADPPRTASTCGGFGLWTLYSVTLPPSADNNPSVRIGFRWTNDNGGVGVNPSFAVDNIELRSTQVPVADFIASSTIICAGDCIDFLDQSTNNPTSYSWSFFGAAPATSSVQNPTSICFNTPGTYTIQLIVSNTSGTDTLTIPDYITVNTCSAPEAGFIADSTLICERSCVNFLDQSTGGASSWLWFFPGGTPSSSTQQNPSGICYFTPGTYDVTQIVFNAFGSDTLTIPLYINVNNCPLPEADFISSTPDICSNRCISFFDLSTENPTGWRWFFPGATPDTSTAQNPTGICYAADGFYDVRLIVSNQYGSDTLIRYSYIHVESVPGAFVSPDTAMFFGSSYQLLAGGGTTYQWTPATGLDTTGGPNPVASPTTTTTYTVSIFDALSGCSTIRQVTVTILHNNNYFVPNTFSPNKDGRNDYLFVRGNNLYGIRFSVYDRWGEKVFETSNANEGWDGTYKGKELDPGVFVYVLTVNYDDGKTLTEKGSVTLIR